MGLLDKLFKGLTDRELNKIMKQVELVENHDQAMQDLSDAELAAKTTVFKKRIEEGETLDDLMPEAFAVVREAAVRTLGMKHYPVQIAGGIVMHQGRIAEMKTGEGKTLSATLPAYLNALTGEGVHVVTVNDYLAKRDKEWMGKIFEFLGLTVAYLIHGVEGADRKAAYQADITYGTNNEFGFDYLRDNMVVFKERLMQRPLHYAIVDEVDSILIDEARTPLIISGAGSKSTELYHLADQFVRGLKHEVDYTVDEKAKSVVLTDESGVTKAERFFNIDNLSDPENMTISHHVNQALKARAIMKRDVDYVEKEGEIVIVDEFTGRLMFGRRYSNGLHQAIEAKEGLDVQKESQTLATITIQNYFRMYQKLSGMTGTAKTEEDEFTHIYNMNVLEIPTNKPVVRDDMDDAIFKSLAGKFRAVLADIEERHKMGQPLLVGTISIETSEFLSKMLKKKGIPHEVLNAKQHEREAEIVAQAGRLGQVTIATNMAGRGTDIVLGGNADFMAKRDLSAQGYDDEVLAKVDSPLEYTDEEIIEAKALYKELLRTYKATTDEEAAKVKAAGGLHIIGTERHESRRIDNQLRGRAGRQGDPGSSQFYISFEDDLMRLFIPDRVKGMVEKMGMDEDTPLEAGVLSKSIENAQKRVEGRNFGIRKHVLQYDDVMNRQREIIYKERGKVLHGDDLRDEILEMLDKLIDRAVDLHAPEGTYPEEWELDQLMDFLHGIYLPKEAVRFDQIETLTQEKLKEDLKRASLALYEEKEAELTPERMREIERYVLLKVVDNKWIDHIDAMDQLKQGIGLRAVGQEDPVRAYQIEGFDMFNEMTLHIQEDTIRYLFGASLQTRTERKSQVTITSASHGDSQAVEKKPLKAKERPGPNDPCHCGSGKKYKKCHMKSDLAKEREV